MTTTYTYSTSSEALHQLLAVSQDIHSLNRLSHQLCAERLGQEAAQPVTQRAWSTLCDAVADLRAGVVQSLDYAEALLIHPSSALSPISKRLDKQLVERRQAVLALLRQYQIDQRIMTAIEETLEEEATAIFALLELNWKEELFAFFRDFVPTLDKLILALQGAQDPFSQATLLSSLAPPDADCGDDLFFDVFAEEASIQDLELTLAAIAAYAVLRA